MAFNVGTKNVSISVEIVSVKDRTSVQPMVGMDMRYLANSLSVGPRSILHFLKSRIKSVKGVIYIWNFMFGTVHKDNQYICY